MKTWITLYLLNYLFRIFNAVGNHDIENRQLYLDYFGQTYYSFPYGHVMMVFFDTEVETCNIGLDQEDMLSKALDTALKDENIHNIFIFMHRTLFLENDALHDLNIPETSPNVWDCYGETNFDQIMEEQILRLPHPENRSISLRAMWAPGAI